MENLILPKQYKSELNLHDTQLAIKTVKDFFQALLAQRLHLTRVSAPLFVDPATGLNDNLNGYERPVTFGIKEQDDKNAEVVHSLAKWKRYALKKYGFQVGEGIYTDMNAIRRDESTDNIHSIFVDQWDWEKIIHKEDRNLDYLKETVRTVYKCLRKTEQDQPGDAGTGIFGAHPRGGVRTPGMENARHPVSRRVVLGVRPAALVPSGRKPFDADKQPLR